MFYFLGIVKKADVEKGIIDPSYVLCKAHGGSENRSGYRINYVPTGVFHQMNKVLVTKLVGNDALIEFMSHFRTRHHMHGSKYDYESTKKYYPQGSLFYFPCNIYGQRIGTPVWIKRVPDSDKTSKADAGFRTLKEQMSKRPSLKDKLVCDRNFYNLNQSETKLKFYQERIPGKKRRENNG